MPRIVLVVLMIILASGCVISANEGLMTDGDTLVTTDRTDLVVRITGQSTEGEPGEHLVAFAQCPPGYTAIGGGHAFTTRGGVDIADWDFYPWRSLPWRAPNSTGPHDQWRVEGILDGDFERWRLWVTATCFLWSPEGINFRVPDVAIPMSEAF